MQLFKRQLPTITILLLTSVALVACKQTANESDSTNLKSNQEITNMRNTPCDNLHKVTDIDDLIRQMYDTAFKDDCLYEMSNEELEYSLGLPVRRQKPSELYTLQELQENPRIVMLDRDVDSPFDFYLLTNKYLENHSISIVITKKAFDTKAQTLFPDGSFPTFLGSFKKFQLKPQMRESDFPTNYTARKVDDIQDGYIYYWRNSNYPNRLIATQTLPMGAVLSMSFSSNDNTNFLP